ncbi:MAG TPA: dihydrofolate reductase family protein [Ktedonobacterales bacterium]|nr:dihydrofolate reductase family protein [Ktedonobacterales bacterium]
MSDLLRLETLYASQAVAAGHPLPLPPALALLYGPLTFPAPMPFPRPYVIGNFVSTLGGVAALTEPGHGGGGEISGFNTQDRMLMGLLRAVADAVVVGAGTLRADPVHLWTADYVFPALAEPYHTLRAALGKSGPPLNVIVTASGELDTTLPVFQSGSVPTLIVTTPRGARRVERRCLPTGVSVATAPAGAVITTGAVLAAIAQARAGDVIVVEGGPHLMGDFLAERCLDELFLTLAPQIAGRSDAPDVATRLAFVAGKVFAPDNPLWGTLTSVHRGGSHLFLRYAFGSALPSGSAGGT